MRRIRILLSCCRTLQLLPFFSWWFRPWPFGVPSFPWVWQLSRHSWCFSNHSSHRGPIVIRCSSFRLRRFRWWVQRGRRHIWLRIICCWHRLPFSRQCICLRWCRACRRGDQGVLLSSIRRRWCQKESFPIRSFRWPRTKRSWLQRRKRQVRQKWWLSFLLFLYYI
jgi:hypothetical protein